MPIKQITIFKEDVGYPEKEITVTRWEGIPQLEMCITTYHEKRRNMECFAMKEKDFEQFRDFICKPYEEIKGD